MTLGELIKSKGYIQKYIHEKITDKGVDVDYPHFNRWCSNHFKPREDSVYKKIAKVLGVTEQEIRECFNK